MPFPSVALVVVAAGRGVRLGADRPKQYLPCAGKPLLAHTLEALLAARPFSAATVVIHADDRAHYHAAVERLSPAAKAAVGPPSVGGATRQASVRAGLEALAAAAPDIVLIHDAARPFPSPALIRARGRGGRSPRGGGARRGLERHGQAGRCGGSGARDPAARFVEGGADAAGVPLPLILEAHRRAAEAGVGDLTDDVAVAEWAGAAAFVFEGDPKTSR